MKKSLQKGFTLIELLVVIAIIGILSSVVLASLTTARSKGSDAAIQSTVSNMRAQAELYYSNNNTYGATYTVGNCPTAVSATGTLVATSTTGGLGNLVVDLVSKTGGAANTRCEITASAWAVAGKTSTGYACADSSGQSLASSTGAIANSIASGVCVK